MIFPLGEWRIHEDEAARECGVRKSDRFYPQGKRQDLLARIPFHVSRGTNCKRRWNDCSGVISHGWPRRYYTDRALAEAVHNIPEYPAAKDEPKATPQASQIDDNDMPSGALPQKSPCYSSLCNLCVLCVSVVKVFLGKTTTETQRTQRLHREEVDSKIFEAKRPSGIFDERLESAVKAWQLLTEKGRYRVARTEDFSIPEAAIENEDRRRDIQRAVAFAYVGGDINDDGNYKDRAFIVVDMRRNDSSRFGLVILNELDDPKSVPAPYWVYRERDLSSTVMTWTRGKVVLIEYHDDGSYGVCRINWDAKKEILM